jgi:hypothetical protein
VALTLGGGATSGAQISSGTAEVARQRPRVVVTTDPELDDSNSLIRYLLFSTDFRTTTLQVPTDAAAGQTIHLVLEATDKGTPPLTHYQRVVVSVTR